MENYGLNRGRNKLKIYMMIKLTGKVTACGELAEVSDGFSIGSNDLTQLVLGHEHDSELISELFDNNKMHK